MRDAAELAGRIRTADGTDVPAQREAPTRSIRVLVADDEADIRQVTTLTLALDGDDIVILPEACDGAAALAAWRHHRPDVMVIDHRMPHLTGLDVAALALAEDPTAAIVLFSASLDPVTIRWAEAIGVVCLVKTQMDRLPGVVRELSWRRSSRAAS